MNSPAAEYEIIKREQETASTEAAREHRRRILFGEELRSACKEWGPGWVKDILQEVTDDLEQERSQRATGLEMVKSRLWGRT